MAEFSDLLGKTLVRIDGGIAGSEEMRFYTQEARVYRMYHSQNCCESVDIYEIHGDLDDLMGSPILLAEEVTLDNQPAPDGSTGYYSYTWTFYKLATAKGHVTIRWLGESNGYYSESVDFEEIKN